MISHRLKIVAAVCVLLLLLGVVLFFYRSQSVTVSAAGLPETDRQSDPSRGSDERSARLTAKTGEAGRFREVRLKELEDRLKALEQGRVVDSAFGKRKFPVTDSIRELLKASNDADFLVDEISSVVVDAPGEEERARILGMIDETLNACSFGSDEERELLRQSLISSYLSFPLGKKVVRGHLVRESEKSPVQQWVDVFNAGEVFESDAIDGLILNAKEFSSAMPPGGRLGGIMRYGNLVGIRP